ncbi:MAG: DUF2726 domain-containing protein [Christensenellaceae bacterium]|jgi:hypothetical protein|nr:DUF2726 domain-containing protein [Christensenellaceae bacterium]
MEILLNYVVPIVVIIIVATIYFLWITGRNSKPSVSPDETEVKDEWKRTIPKSAPIVPYLETKIIKFYEILKMSLPSGFMVIPHCPIEKLFVNSKRKELKMLGQYADFVIFDDAYMPVLVIDLFDMSVVNLDTVNKIKTIFKDVLKNSGVAVMDYKLDGFYNIDQLRRDIAMAINPLNKK